MQRHTTSNCYVMELRTGVICVGDRETRYSSAEKSAEKSAEREDKDGLARGGLRRVTIPSFGFLRLIYVSFRSSQLLIIFLLVGNQLL